MNRAYSGLVQTDMLLWAAVLRKYDTSPEDFDPPSDPPPVLRPGLPPLARPIEHLTCGGLLMVHELRTVCSEEAVSVCRWTQRPVEHSYAVLDREANCELCPYGSNWAL
jgi:hypothetical protein